MAMASVLLSVGNARPAAANWPAPVAHGGRLQSPSRSVADTTGSGG
jgi:hypothetical protein